MGATFANSKQQTEPWHFFAAVFDAAQGQTEGNSASLRER